MRIEYDFDYDVAYSELADEFNAHDSEYQADFFNDVGSQFKFLAQDKTKTSTYIQLLEIAEQLNNNGKWFIETLCEYMEG